MNLSTKAKTKQVDPFSTLKLHQSTKKLLRVAAGDVPVVRYLRLCALTDIKLRALNSLSGWRDWQNDVSLVAKVNDIRVRTDISDLQKAELIIEVTGRPQNALSHIMESSFRSAIRKDPNITQFYEFDWDSEAYQWTRNDERAKSLWQAACKSDEKRRLANERRKKKAVEKHNKREAGK